MSATAVAQRHTVEARHVQAVDVSDLVVLNDGTERFDITLAPGIAVTIHTTDGVLLGEALRDLGLRIVEGILDARQDRIEATCPECGAPKVPSDPSCGAATCSYLVEAAYR